MLNEKIGQNAGNLWLILKENGPMNASALKKNSKLTEKDMNLGLGWLAREGKLSFESKKDQTMIILKE